MTNFFDKCSLLLTETSRFPAKKRKILHNFVAFFSKSQLIEAENNSVITSYWMQITAKSKNYPCCSHLPGLDGFGGSVEKEGSDSLNERKKGTGRVPVGLIKYHLSPLRREV